jgi:hypothetical protein
VKTRCPTPTAGSPNKVTSEGGVLVQDKWTVDRLTVSAGLRIDWFFSENPAFHLSPSMLTPNRNYDVPKFSTTQYKDWTPKVAAAYDLFGDGRTALKVNLGRYVLGQALSSVWPARRLQRATHVVAGVDRQRRRLRPRLRLPVTQPGSHGGRATARWTPATPQSLRPNFYSNSLIPNLAVRTTPATAGANSHTLGCAVSLQPRAPQGLSIRAASSRRFNFW